jgi:hypothetical protein
MATDDFMVWCHRIIMVRTARHHYIQMRVLFSITDDVFNGRLAWYIFDQRLGSKAERDELAGEGKQLGSGKEWSDHKIFAHRWLGEAYNSVQPHEVDGFGEDLKVSGGAKFVHGTIIRADQFKHGRGFKIIMKMTVHTPLGIEILPLSMLSTDELAMPAKSKRSEFLANPIGGFIYLLKVEPFGDLNLRNVDRFRHAALSTARIGYND